MGLWQIQIGDQFIQVYDDKVVDTGGAENILVKIALEGVGGTKYPILNLYNAAGTRLFRAYIDSNNAVNVELLHKINGTVYPLFQTGPYSVKISNCSFLIPDDSDLNASYVPAGRAAIAWDDTGKTIKVMESDGTTHTFSPDP